MLDFQELLISKLPEFEGKVDHLYLDTHIPPLPTTGIGCAITLMESLTLPWQIAGTPATQTQIHNDWVRVTGMRGGMAAEHYYLPGVPILSDDAINALVAKRLDAFTANLQEIFLDFLSWPVQAKAATLDMLYGLGRSKFVGQYPLFRAAATRHDWKTCAAQSAMNANDKAYDTRNQWLRLMFLQAAGQ